MDKENMDAEKVERFRCGVKNYSGTAFCVNALKEAAFISAGSIVCYLIGITNMCQCPERGRPSFLHR